MRKSTHPAGYFPALQTAPIAAKTAQVHLGSLFVLLAGLCFITPLDVHAGETDLTSPDIGNNSLIALAKFIKRADTPACWALSFLSGGRLNVVLPPKMIVNKLMDSVVNFASATK